VVFPEVFLRRLNVEVVVMADEELADLLFHRHASDGLFDPFNLLGIQVVRLCS
jgi:hypothetical protein